MTVTFTTPTAIGFVVGMVFLVGMAYSHGWLKGSIREINIGRKYHNELIEIMRTKLTNEGFVDPSDEVELDHYVEVVETAEALIKKLDETLPHINNMVIFNHARGLTYTGPDISAELEALRTALKAAETVSE